MKSFFKISLILLIVLFLVKHDLIFSQEMPEQGQNQPMQPPVGQQVIPESTTKGPEMPQKETEKVTSYAIPPILEIKPLETTAGLLYSFELRDVELGDLFRVLAHDYKLNLLVDKDVQGKVTASLSNASLEEALETIAESQNLILEKKKNVIWVRPNFITKIFNLKYIEAKKILEPSSSQTTGTTTPGTAGQGATGATAPTTSGGGQAPAQPSPSTAAPTGGSATGSTTTAGTSSTKQPNTIYDLLSQKGKVLLGEQPNSIIVIDYPPNVEKIEKYLKEIDGRMSSRIFKLKYLKARELVEQSTTAQTQTQTQTSTGGATSGTTTASTTGGSTGTY